MKKIVIVGNGMAGFRLCQLLVEQGRRFDVTVFGAERLPAYDRVHLSRYLERPHAERLLLAPRSWYEARGVTLYTGDRVVGIDRDRRRVRSVSGREVAYDRLVLATGSAPFEPPIEGIRSPGVFVYRTVDDLEGIRIRASAARQAVVLGGGLLGLEAARGIQELGLRVTVVEAAERIMPRQLDPGSAALLQRHVEALGIDVRLGVRAERIEAGQQRCSVVLDDGDALDAELVVVAAGVRPRDALAMEAGLALGPRGGFAVDDAMRTSDRRILAIGECASHAGAVPGMVSPCYRMAEVAGERLRGRRARFRGADPSWRLKVAGIDAAVVGAFDPDGEVVAHERGGARRSLAVEGQRIVGACGVGDWPELWRLQEAIRRGRRLSRRRLERFERHGSFLGEDTAPPVSAWPAAATVCNCRNVTRGQLSTAIRRGACSVDSLCAATRAGSVCGSCVPLIASLCRQPSDVGAPRGISILSSFSLLALVACAVLLWPGSFVWRTLDDPKLTGFGLLGACGLAALLPLRKRLRWLRLGDFGWWRAVHAGIGAGAVVMLGAHTGLEIGDNFNRLLGLTFLGVVATGALTGIIASVESGGAGTLALHARRYRRPIAWSHWLLLWILPVLIGFHVVAAYYY